MNRVEGFAPGRLDLLNANNPVIRSAALIVAPLTFCACDMRCANPGRICLVTPDGKGGWENRPLQQAIETRWPGQVAVDCNVSMTRDDVICLMLTLTPLEHPNANWSPGIFGRPAFWLRDFPIIHRVVWLESRDGGRTFTSREIIDHNSDRGTLLPTMEQPTGFNEVTAGQLPPLLYFEGLSRYRNPDEVIQNDVFFVLPQ